MSILYKHVTNRAGSTRPRLRILGLLLVALAATGFALIPAAASKAAGGEEIVTTFGGEGTEGGQFKLTANGDIAVDETTEDVYVADTTNDRVQELGPEGEFVRAWGEGVVATGTGKADAEQSVRVQATGGDFTLTFGGDKTAEIPWDATAATVQTELEALASIAGKNVEVTGGPGDQYGTKPYIVKFVGTLAEKAQTLMTVATGATSPLSGGKKEVTDATINPGETGFDICEAAADCKAGTATATDGGMNKPDGIAVNQTTGDVYVFDEGYARVDEFSANGAFIRSWGDDVVSSGPGKADAQDSLTVAASGGTFTLTLGGDTTGAIAYDASAATVQGALEALASVGAGNVTVSGGPGNEAGSTPYVVTFVGALGEAAQTLTETGTALTGGAKAATIEKMHTGATGFDVCEAARGDLCVTGQDILDDYKLGGGFGSSDKGAIAVDPTSGDVIVGDSYERRVEEFGPEGAFILAFGDKVVSSGPDDKGEVFDVCVNANGDVCSEAHTSGDGEGEFATSSPAFLTVSSSGAIFATDSGNSRVLEFTPGATPALITPSVFAESRLSGSPAPAALAFEPNAEGERVLAVKPNTAETESLLDEFRTEGLLVKRHYEGLGLPTPDGVAYDAASERVYWSTASDTVDVLSFTPGVVRAPSISNVAASGVESHVATFTAEVDPNGFETTYRFEYSTNGSTWTGVPATEVGIGEGATSVAVTQTAEGLSAGTVYLLRVSAHNAGGAETSSPVVFTTGADTPAIVQTLASPVSASGATLTAYINPEGAATSYQFEYGTSAAYGNTAPSFERQLGAGQQPIAVSEPLSGLTPETEYDYRLRATNASGTREATGSFKTTTPAGACANEVRREENNSTGLPDCRAFEQVTPQYKNSTPPTSVVAVTPEAHWVDGGERVIDPDNVGIFDEDNTYDSPPNSAYSFTRKEDVGWATSPLTPYVAGETGGTDALDATTPNGETSLFLRGEDTSGAGGAFWLEQAGGTEQEVGPAGPADAKVAYRGSSSDLSDVTFALVVPKGVQPPQTQTWPGDDTVSPSIGGEAQSLYEYHGSGHTGLNGEVPALLDSANGSGGKAGAQLSTCGDEAGGGAGHETARDLSAGGSTVIFSVRTPAADGGAACSGPSATQLLARVGPPAAPAEATVVNLAAAQQSDCASSPWCGVSVAPTYVGASSDGSKVFFTSTQPLLSGDGDTTNNLYECVLPGDGGEPPAKATEGVVNACPELKELTDTGAGQEAKVKGVVAVAEDGARVYYVAEGALTHAEDAAGQTAAAGQDNLYVYDTQTEATSFVATLAAADSADWGPDAAARPAQATPDGEYLVFTSAAQLTPEDSSTAAQVFRYDAASGELIRVSFGQEGYGDDGNSDTHAASIPQPQITSAGPSSLQNSAISEGGDYIVFVSEAALTPNAIAGQENAYEYHDGNVSLIYDGKQPYGYHEEGAWAGGYVLGIDSSGKDVFLATSEQLVPGDRDTQTDLYDARAEGGFPAPLSAPGCEGERCLGPLTAPLTPVVPGSTNAPILGNLVTPPEKKAEEEKPAKKAVGKVKIAEGVVHGKTIVLSVKAPGKGKLTVAGKGLKQATKIVKGNATYKLKLKLTTAEQKKLTRKKKLTLKVKVAFKPASGKSSSMSVNVRLRS